MWLSKSDQKDFVGKADPSSIINNNKELSIPLCYSLRHQDDDDENNLTINESGVLSSKPAHVVIEGKAGHPA